ncbi:MAG: hypothetical protein RI894_1358 [Bacteroidota bacterium]|jgi:5-methylcytosine-specific restriction endonuclease McrA
MNRIWRWDQGRLNYFRFDNLQLIAQAILGLDGTIINSANIDPLRYILEAQTGLPFSPQNYKVWRNYKRVFECSMLATSIDNHLFVSDIAKKIAENTDFEADDYLSFFATHFRYPFPAFSDYNADEPLVYPFCALLKYLIAHFEQLDNTFITLEDVFSKIIGNNCTGFEDLYFYKTLKPTNRKPVGEEQRQVREMLIFISQLSILKWHTSKLFLDVSAADLLQYNNFENLTTPVFTQSTAVKVNDFIAITTVEDIKIKPFDIQSRELASDDLFTEGKRVRVSHIKIERSSLLRKLFFQYRPTTICDMCEKDMQKVYSWTDNLLEIHHVLPLSSCLTITSAGTSLEDIVPLCPNCHRSVHSYYKIWLNQNLTNDFRSKVEAFGVYGEAKNKIAI